ncbi:helix-turn-helix transcriptional regulator [Rhodanobacter sp. OK091]|jgi:putative transcriptional regulator|uniref:helix-turn-helix domain-containing protein n=1 Tax=Rhodanobacter sp. OK091 TaxID=1881037 RepID=UPI00092069B9|nr:helix-turn-helix transcriptional regulator [Rhodanobacter sp. OK091]SHM15990.1 transcriptional regulator, XRE family [Rhodanobacter sp. OK091]
MPIRVTLDDVLAARQMKAKQLAALVGVSETHLSLFRSGKVRGVRFSTLMRLCAALNCQPGELLSYEHDDSDLSAVDEES